MALSIRFIPILLLGNNLPLEDDVKLSPVLLIYSCRVLGDYLHVFGDAGAKATYEEGFTFLVLLSEAPVSYLRQ